MQPESRWLWKARYFDASRVSPAWREAQVMRNARRPMGRFFCLLMWMAAAAMLPLPVQAQASGPAMTQVVDTVYRADGTTATGTVLISWPAFTTADGKAVAAGSLSVHLGNGGTFAASLAPNTGAQPAGVYYRVVYQLTGQEPSSEYWVVPATGSTSNGSVRAKLMPPTIAAQVLTRDVADTNYVHVVGDQTVAGVKTFSTVNAQIVNGTVNAAAFPGADIGAMVNAAIAACSGNIAGQQCEVRIPQGVFNHTTTMNLTAGVVLRCSGQETTTLNYTGSGTAINFAASGAQIHDCGLTLGTSAQVGLDMAGHHGIADGVYLQGGGAGTTLIRVHSDVNMLSKVRESGILGTGIQVDHATDTYLTDVNIYGVPGNTTSQTLVVDTLAGGVQVENFSGGYSGLHGLVVRNAMADHAAGGPSWLFFRNFVADCSAGGDGWLFDSSLGNAQLGATFLDSWSAGAGKNCTNNTVVTANAAGIRISGGRGIHIGGGSKIRANEGSGIAIDNSNAGNIQIEDSFIYGNNNQNAGTAQGIDATSYVDGLSITGNTIGNYSYEPGYQQYGVRISPGGSQNLVIASNTFSGNTAGAILNPSSPALYVQFGNTNSNGTASPNSVLLGDVAAYDKGSAFPAPWIVAQRGALANYKFGYGLNCHWSGSAWQFDTDGANNGGACLFGEGSTGHVDLYTVPTNVPASGQSLTPAQLENFKRVHFDAAGAVQFFGDLSTTGTLTAQQATFTGTTTVPAPVNPTDAATKGYVDTVVGGSGGGSLSSPGPIGNTTPNTGAFTTLSAQVEGKRYKVEGFPSSCTVNSVAYSTQFDCAFQTAYYAAQTQSATQTLELGNAVYLTNVGLQQSSVYVVNIIGAAKTDTTEGLNGGSVIRLNSTVATPVVTLAKLAAAPLRSSLVYRDFVIDANHKSPVCLDASSMRDSLFSNIACENATGSNYWVRFGDSSGSYGQNYDMQVGPIKIVSPYAYNTRAVVTANVVGGAIATNGYAVNNGGSGYLNGPSVPAYLTESGAGATPCSTMPTGLHTTVAAGVVTAVSSSTGASGCSGNIYVNVSDLPAAAYGFRNEFTTDSTFTDIIVEGVGQVAAIYDFGNAANVWIHAHPWQYQPVGVESHGPGFYWGLQCDSMVKYCVDFESGNGSPQLFNTLIAEAVAGSSMYYFGPGLLDGSTRDDYAPGNIPADWHRFVSSAVGPLNESVANFQNYFPASFQALGFKSFNAPAVEKFDYHGFGDQFIFGDIKSAVNLKGIVTHFATTNMVNGSLLQGFSDNAVTRKWLIDSSTGIWYSPNIQGNDTIAGHGFATLQTGDATHSGFIKWFNPSGTALGYMGYDNTNKIGLWMQGGYPFDLEGGAFQIGGNTVLDTSRNATVNNLTVNGTCTGCGGGGPGREYFVSTYGSIQAAIDAAYNNGSVQGEALVIDDRTAPYSGPGFIVRDSVTVKLAATTYTITGTVSNNNGVSNVTAGILSMPGSHIVGAGTSANHGTNVNAGAGLNADLIATSTVGTGAGANAQWWHWGSIENFHMDGNKANQTAGNCINVENMGETAVLRALEVGNCYGDDIRLEGNFATQSEISNVTVNSAGQFGVDLDNFQGVGVLRGLSGDSNATSIIRFNGSQSATLTVLGMKSEEEISGHDPLITIDMPADGSQPAFYLVGGYTYARPGVHDVVKIINGKSGSAPFVQVNNFYVDANFVNAVNDTVNSRTFAASNMNKVPFSYLPTGSYQSGQAFTFAPGTFIQGGSSALTEIFGSSTDGSSMIAAQGNGDGTSYYTGGLKIGIPNRTQFGQPPEMMARMGSRFLGVGQGYDTNTWVFVPIWKSGDSSNRWIGEPNQRWPEVYAGDVNATTATVGTLNVTNCTGCGSGGGGVTSVNSRTGTVVPATNDYSFSQISGSVSHSQLPTLLSADIPNNTANTTGSAGSLSGASALPNGTTATTQAANNNSTQVATTAYADAGDAGKVNRATVTAYGACGDATHVCQVTTNSQGLVTNETTVTITAAAPTIGFATQTGGSLSTTTTNYVALGAGAAVNATEIYLQVPIARAGTISNCRARLTASQTAGNGWIFTIRKNGAACAGISMACVGAQTCSDTSNTCSLAAGDLIDIQAAVSGSPSTSAVYGTCLFQ